MRSPGDVDWLRLPQLQRRFRSQEERNRESWKVVNLLQQQQWLRLSTAVDRRLERRALVVEGTYYLTLHL